MAIADWERWIKASIAKHFDTNRDGLTMYVDPEYRDTNDETSFFTLRIDGLDITEYSNSYVGDVEINCLITTVVDDADNYQHERDIGKIHACFLKTIGAFEYGDSGDQFACMRRRSEIVTNRFGQVETSVKLQQSAVVATYTVELGG